MPNPILQLHRFEFYCENYVPNHLFQLHMFRKLMWKLCVESLFPNSYFRKCRRRPQNYVNRCNFARRSTFPKECGSGSFKKVFLQGTWRNVTRHAPAVLRPASRTPYTKTHSTYTSKTPGGDRRPSLIIYNPGHIWLLRINV